MQATVFYILTVVDAVFEKTTLLPTLQLLVLSVIPRSRLLLLTPQCTLFSLTHQS